MVEITGKEVDIKFNNITDFTHRDDCTRIHLAKAIHSESFSGKKLDDFNFYLGIDKEQMMSKIEQATKNREFINVINVYEINGSDEYCRKFHKLIVNPCLITYIT